MSHDLRTTQRLARISGLLYVIVAVLGMFAGTVSASFLVAGDESATAGKVLESLTLFRVSIIAWLILLFAELAVAVTLFMLLKPVSTTLSLLASAFRVVYATIQGINLLNLFNVLLLLTVSGYAAGFNPQQVNAQASFSLAAFVSGFRIGLVFFGAHLIALGYLLVRSRYVPRVIGVLVVAAGFGYLMDSLGHLLVPDYSSAATAVLMTPAVVGELALTVWLLVKGVREHSVEHGEPLSESVATA